VNVTIRTYEPRDAGGVADVFFRSGQGIASRLYEGIEAAAREQGIGRIYTEASELARRFFERKDFTVTERQDPILRGVSIHNYRMAKTLS
jgi:putative acetyltransferase